MPSKYDRSKDSPTIIIGGREHRDWLEYGIDSDLLIPADAWDMSLGIPVSEVPAEVKPWAAVEIRMGDDLVLTGRIDSLERESRKDAREFALRGRDLAAVLTDCSAPIFVTRESSLADIIAKIVRPLGISKIDVQTKDTREKITVEPGMSAWDALDRVCAQNGCAAWFAPDGTLIVGGPDYAAPIVGELYLTLDRQRTNVLRLRVEEDATDMHSEVAVLGQTHGTEGAAGQHNIKATAKSAVLGNVNRPLIVVDSECDTQALAERRARKEVADAELSGFTITAEVRGHRSEEGVLWLPGQRLRVVSEPDGIDDVFFLMARRISGGRERGQRTELTLKRDGVWLPDLAKGKGKSGTGKPGKNTAPLRVVDTAG